MTVIDIAVPGGDSTVHYTVTGTGPGVLLAHGTGSAKEGWTPLTEALCDRFTTVAVDLSGSGATTDPGGVPDADLFTAQLIGVADAVGLDRFHVVGQSMGAVVAAVLAARHPARVRSATLVSGWVTTDARAHVLFDYWTRLLRADPALWARSVLVDAMSEEFFRDKSVVELREFAATLASAVPPGTARQCAFDQDVDIDAQLRAVRCPSLVVGCTHDRMIPVGHQREMARLIPGADYIELAAGHGLPFEHPALFIRTIADFLDTHPR